MIRNRLFVQMLTAILIYFLLTPFIGYTYAIAQTQTEKTILDSLSGITFTESTLANIKSSSNLSSLGFDYIISQKADKYKFEKTGGYIKVDGVYNNEFRTGDNINDIVILSPNSYAFSISGLLKDNNGSDAWIILNYCKSSYLEKASGKTVAGSSNDDIKDAVSFFFDDIKDDLSFSHVADCADDMFKYLLLTDANIAVFAREVQSQSKTYLDKTYSLTVAFPQYSDSLSSVYTFNGSGEFITAGKDAATVFPTSGNKISLANNATKTYCAIKYDYTSNEDGTRWVICDFSADTSGASSETAYRKAFENIERAYLIEYEDVTDEEIDSEEFETEGYHSSADKVIITDDPEGEGDYSSYSSGSGTPTEYDSKILSLNKDPLSYVKDIELSKDESDLSAGEKELRGTAASFYEFIQIAAVVGMVLTIGICAIKLSVYGSKAKPDVEKALLTKGSALFAIFGLAELWSLFIPVLESLV